MKKGKIIISGGGDIEISFKVDGKYFSLLNNNSKIIYIPIALNRDKVGFEACYDWFSALIANHSKEKDIDFTMLLKDDVPPDFEIYDSIYVGGGNTYKLLDYIYRKNIGGKIKKYIKSGGIIYGGSAGAMILGKDIRTAEEENDNNYSHYLGLNLLKGNSVICHYSESLDEKILDVMEKINSKVFALPEDSGIILDSDGKILETVNDIYVFDENGKSKI